MGTTYSVKFSTLKKVETNQLYGEIDLALIQLNKKMSTYDKNSELSKINQDRGVGWLKISSELLFVLKKALEISKSSGGAYDVTLGPLVNLWGFGPQGKQKIPKPEKIKEVLKYVGLDKLEIDFELERIKKADPKVYIDLSSIAKGHGVDLMAQILEKANLENYLVEIGGELRARGLRNGKVWTVGIEAPEAGISKKQIEKVVPLKNLSMATSGSYRNFFKQGGKEYSHTISYLTGRPVENKLLSVTVLDSKDCMSADALATALMALGEKRGIDLAEKMDIPSFFIYIGDDQKVKTHSSREFTELVGI